MFLVAENKKHHYVPRFYLRHFTADGRSLSLYNLGRDIVIGNANLKNQCYRDYMYGKDGKQEGSLSLMEGALAELLRRILTYRVLPPPWSPDHESLCVLTLLQNARTAYASDAMDEFSDKMWKQVLKKDSRFPPAMMEKVRVVNTDPANFAIVTMLRLYHLIMDLDYRLLLAHEGSEFITSDNPVVLYNQLLEFESMGSNTGLASKGLQIFFPLSPKVMLTFFDRYVYAFVPRQSIVAPVPTREDMNQLNALQVASALENVYFSSAAADIYRIVTRAKPRRRNRKAKIIVLPEKQTETGSSQLIGGSREDVRTNLSLTFVKLLKPAKRWQAERKKPGLKPVTVVRNPGMVRDHELFHEAVDAKRYQPTEFVRFVREKYDA
ncbi:DUF4238 domain-containing protein [Rhodoferax sediminis]|uniref:DUF4238 domain-containing protein n=1 Tax=Rhodoferax sediminis TaxID=2509614 RepID=A0A515D9G9_9BURK|nr:DUF4238 domain-containing protein [Rhodoferax sediminis]